MGDVVDLPLKTKKQEVSLQDLLKDAIAHCERGVVILGYTADFEPYLLSTDLENEDIIQLMDVIKERYLQDDSEEDVVHVDISE